MSQSAPLPLVDLQRRLDEAGIPSALIGGLAIGAWAKARLTRDVDIKILLHRQEHQRLLDLLTPDYHSLQADPVLALRTNGIIFVLNSESKSLRSRDFSSVFTLVTI